MDKGKESAEPLDEAVKKEIDGWRQSGPKYDAWVLNNIDKINEIYCNKETIISDRYSRTSLPIKKISLKNHSLHIEGEGFKIWMHSFEYSFGEKYQLYIKEFDTSGYGNRFTIRFKAYG